VNRPWSLFLGCLAATTPLEAQTVIRPAPTLDSARVVIRDALWDLRDSLLTIDGAAARLQRDYRQASGPALLARARYMSQACARSSKTVAPARSVVRAADVSAGLRLQHQRNLLLALDSLKLALGACEKEFAAMSRPGQAETVRGYGNDRAQRVQTGLRSYERILRGFLRVMEIPDVPPGITSPSVSG
jgi:hypothetical protein